MLPEPTLPKRRRAAPGPAAAPQPWAMTPLFAVPDNPEPDVIPSPGRPAAHPAGRSRRAGSRLPASRAHRSPGQVARKEQADLLVVTGERLRRALGRSFLRYGIPGDPESAVHAAMNVIEPVLDARDTEILRLRRLLGPKLLTR